MPKLLDHIQKGDIDPSVIITHRLSLQDAPDGYSTFLKKSGPASRSCSISGEKHRQGLEPIDRTPNGASGFGFLALQSSARLPKVAVLRVCVRFQSSFHAQ